VVAPFHIQGINNALTKRSFLDCCVSFVSVRRIPLPITSSRLPAPSIVPLRCDSGSSLVAEDGILVFFSSGEVF